MLPNPTTLTEWLATNRVVGVEVAGFSVPVDGEDEFGAPMREGATNSALGEVDAEHPRPRPAAGIHLTLWLDYDSALHLRSLLARMFDQFVWVEVRRLTALPVAAARRFHCGIDLRCYQPADVFHSELAVASCAASASPSELRDELSDTLFAALHEYTADHVEFRGEMEGLLSDYMTPKYFSSDGDKIDSFLAHLSTSRRQLVEDCRVVSHLAHSHLDTVDALDEWHHRERRSEDGSIRGLRLSFDPLFGKHRNQNTAYPEELSAASESEMPPPRELLGAFELAELIGKVDTPTYRKRNLLTMLQDLPRTPEVDAHILRLAAVPSVQIDVVRLLPTVEAAAPLVEELVFAEDSGRVAHALAELEGFGSAFDDPLEAWRRAAKPARRPLLRVDLGVMNQWTILDGMREVTPAFQARLATELCRETRPDTWMTSGLEMLSRTEAPQLANVARILSHHESDHVRSWAQMILDAASRSSARATAEHEQILEADVVVEGLENLFANRLRLWRQSGYAFWRYQQHGHRSPQWDSLVERAHAVYDPEVGRQDPELRSNCDAAIDAGCRDAMVYYRRGIAAFGDQDFADGRHWFGESLPLFDRYVDNPYRAAAAETLAEFYRKDHRRDEALRYFKMAVEFGPCSYSSHLALGELESELTALSAADGDLAARGCLQIGEIRAFPSAVHPDRVSALTISPGGAHALSADASGYLQVTLLSRGDFGRVIPIDGWQAHPAGSTKALWIDDSTLLSAGSDGAVRTAEFDDDRLSGFTVLRELESAITAMIVLSDGRVAIATADGAVRVWNRVTDESVELERHNRQQAIVEFRGSAAWLLGLAANSELEAWPMGMSAADSWHRPHEGYPLVIAEFVSEEIALICNSQGHSWHVNMATGQSSEMQLLHVDPPPIEARFELETQTTVWGCADGRIVVQSPEPRRNLTIVHNSLSCLAVSFATGMLVHVDAAHRLACHAFMPVES